MQDRTPDEGPADGTGRGDDARPDADPEPSLAARAGQQLGLFALAAVGVLVLGLLAGWLFAKSSPQRAAGTLVDDFVVVEPDRGDQPPPPDEVAPTSGAHEGGTAVCGRVAAPLSATDQLATLASGAVVIQYDASAASDPTAVDEEVLADLAGREGVTVAPNPGLEDPIVATAWRRRLVLPDTNRDLLGAFVTAYAGNGPAPGPCPTAGDVDGAQ